VVAWASTTAAMGVARITVSQRRKRKSDARLDHWQNGMTHVLPTAAHSPGSEKCWERCFRLFVGSQTLAPPYCPYLLGSAMLSEPVCVVASVGMLCLFVCLFVCLFACLLVGVSPGTPDWQSVARLREERERELRVLHDSRAGALEDSLQDVTLKFTRLREDFRYNLTVRGSWSLHTKPTHFSLPPHMPS
jgi:hypothetical protein